MEKSRREARMERRQAERRKGQMRTLIYIVVAAVAVAGLLIYRSQVRTPTEEISYQQKAGNLLGDPEAPVHIIEYADFQCIHCYNFYNDTEALLIENYVDTGEVFFEYRLVDFLGDESRTAAEAAYCAADQELFWEYHSVVFNNYSQGNSGGYSEGRLIDFAEALDMDIDQFTECLQSGEKSAVIDGNLEAAQTSGVTGTPGFVINGTVTSGAIPYATLEEMIQAALDQAS